MEDTSELINVKFTIVEDKKDCQPLEELTEQEVAKRLADSETGPSGATIVPEPTSLCNGAGIPSAYEDLREIIGSDGVQKAFTGAAVSSMQRGAVEQQKTLGEASRAKIKADIDTERKLQKLSISFDSHGRVKLSQDSFGGVMNDWADFRIDGTIVRYSCGGTGKVDDEILAIPFVSGKDEKFTVYLNLRNLTKKRVNAAFDRYGLSFGFGERKESEARMTLIYSAIEAATEKVLPPYHGFWKDGGSWAYAYPDAMTWREMMTYV